MARNVLETHTGDTALLRLMLHSGLEGHTLFRMFCSALMREIEEPLCSYVERQQRAGTLRAGEPRLLVRAFMGMLIHHLLIQEIFRVDELGRFSTSDAAEAFVSVFLEGVCVPSSAGTVAQPACG